ncbi:formate dehydrogenase subunit delta [Extensimonas vulgaris]|uniref:Formate dehydrogenase delta subunit n=1 Tax=Extensimonas vulgaris TaxID=1031594 RepID=A0A369AEL1_9BURK|nr:formate dehydrogenase subunit delta [Extensimonas vulgaris]RCX07603.1 formate dehydrogenase delta subunit [Extensimonas vulgaris]TWI35411.1 formate dehydrogenase delta subunit [Extensimonas vulgaris]TXD12987.1 formate dehydrogenase subunit delta [Extensimonas vulgaris]
MDIHHLLRMANQIGTFFEAMPERDQALQEVAQHLRKFWEPRMRRELLAHLDAGGAGLRPIVADALRAHRALVEPPAATSDS